MVLRPTSDRQTSDTTNLGQTDVGHDKRRTVTNVGHDKPRTVTNVGHRQTSDNDGRRTAFID